MTLAVAQLLGLLLLVLALGGGLLLVPLGLPGLWVMLGGALVYWVVLPQGGVGLLTLGGVALLVVLAEVLEWVLSGRYAQKYGGSRRAGWGAIIGGLVGAVVGVPLPVLGSVIGAFAGAFIGAFVAESTVARATRANPTRVATGALVGRVVAAGAKTGIGLLVALWIGSAVVVSHAAGG